MLRKCGFIGCVSLSLIISLYTCKLNIVIIQSKQHFMHTYSFYLMNFNNNKSVFVDHTILKTYNLNSNNKIFSKFSISRISISRGKSGLLLQLYIPKLYCTSAHDQDVQWWRQSDDMIVEYLWNAENVKNIWHVTSSWRRQSMKR